MVFRGKNVLVVGTGLSGIAACGLLKEEGAHVVLFEGNSEAKEEELRRKSPAFEDVKIWIGELPEKAQANWIWRF